jgi:signal peptidase I
MGNQLTRSPNLMHQSSPKPPTPAANPWLETLKTIALSAVLAIGMRQFVAESRVVPTGSMEPTIAINDRFIVDKLSYRFASPKRGDVVVFTPPAAAANCTSAATPPKDAYVKRAIGLPGDRVEVKAGQVLINGQALDENYLKALPTYEMSAVTVPAQQYLVLGDNRNNSCDGHYWGFVPQENIIGKAMVRFWPPDRLGQLSPKPPYQP